MPYAAAQQTYSTTSVFDSTPITAVKAVNRSKIPHGAKTVYSQLRFSAGRKGYNFYRLSVLADATNLSISALKRHLRLLRELQLVIPEHRQGHSNLWFVYDPRPDWDGSLPNRGGVNSERGGGSPVAPIKDSSKALAQKTLRYPIEYECESPPETESPSEPNVNANVIYRCAQEQPQDHDPGSGEIDKCDVDQSPPDEGTAYALEEGCETLQTDLSEGGSAQAQPVEPRNGESTTGSPIDAPTAERSTQDHDKAPLTGFPHEPDQLPISAPSSTQNEKTADRGKVFDATLLKEIEETTGDYHSRGKFIKIIRTTPFEFIRRALSSLKGALHEGIVQHRGKYFVGTINRMMSEECEADQTTYQTTTSENQSTIDYDPGYYPPAPAQPAERPLSIEIGRRNMAITVCCHVLGKISQTECERLIADSSLPLPACVETHMQEVRARVEAEEAAKRNWRPKRESI